jgi:hypothetical protein
MVDFQTLTLFSLTLLTAAMFIFYYLLVIRGRRTPPVYRKVPQTSGESPASVSRTKMEDPTPNPIQIPIQALTQAAIEIKAPIEIPIQTQSQISSQAPVQAISQNSVPAPPDNALNMPAATPTLSGEAATKALKEFAEEIEKGRGPSGEKTRDASLVKLARVLIDVIQAGRAPEKPLEPLNQNKQDVQREKKTVTELPHKHGQSRKKKKAKMHKQRRARTASRKAKNKKKKVKVKGKEHRRQAKRNSKQSRVTSLRNKRARKKRRARKN